MLFTSAQVSIRERPEHALLAMTIVAMAAQLDAYLSSMLITFLGSKAKPSFALFDAIHQTAQNAGLRAVAKSVLSKEDHDIFSALLLLAKAADKHRNRLAHWMWAYSEDLEDGLLFIDPPDNFEFLVQIHEQLDLDQKKRTYVPVNRAKILVYTKKDLESVIGDYEKVTGFFMNFKGHVSPKLETNIVLYRLMLRDTEFLQALDRVTGASRQQPQKSPKNKPPPPPAG